MQYVIFHGSFGSPESNWFPELKDRLEALRQKVLVPTFPVDTWEDITAGGPEGTSHNQTLDNWLAEFEKYVPQLQKEEKLCFIGHSAGPLFILHALTKFNLQLDSAIFVSPFLEDIQSEWQIEVVCRSFYKHDFDWEKLKKLIPTSYTLYSDNDPYVKESLSKDFACKLDSSLIPVKKAGHMNSEVNLNEFPLVYELCKSRIDLSLYQRYLEHRRELYSLDYSKGGSEEVIYLDPSDVFDEGIFKFRNLRKEGFCTLFIDLKYWDVQSLYFQESRKAAKRVPFIRVFVYNNITDLYNKITQDQIEQDLAAGILVYLATYKDVAPLTDSPDFGIWDEEYVCSVGFNDDKEITSVRLSSRDEDIKAAVKVKEQILAKARKIERVEDLQLEKMAVS